MSYTKAELLKLLEAADPEFLQQLDDNEKLQDQVNQLFIEKVQQIRAALDMIGNAPTPLFRTKVDHTLILSDINKMPFAQDGSGALMAVEPCKFPEQLGKHIQAAVDEIAKATNRIPLYMMVNKLPEGCVVPQHSDTVTHNPLRFHLPIVSNNGSFWWDEEYGILRFDVGTWYGPIPYHLQHCVGNVGRGERIHLVVDLSREPINA